MVKPLEDVRELSRLAYGFMASKALFSALHLDVFSRLEERSQTGRELAAETGVAEHRMQTLLSALASVGLIVAVEDRWMNAPASARYLVSGSPAGVGGCFFDCLPQAILACFLSLFDMMYSYRNYKR